MEFVLQVNEAVVSCIIKSDSPKYRAHHIWSDLFSLPIHQLTSNFGQEKSSHNNHTIKLLNDIMIELP